MTTATVVAEIPRLKPLRSLQSNHPRYKGGWAMLGSDARKTIVMPPLATIMDELSGQVYTD